MPGCGLSTIKAPISLHKPRHAQCRFKRVHVGFQGRRVVSKFGGCVELQQVTGAALFAEGHFGIGAVDAAGARAGVGQMRCLYIAAGF